MKKTIITSVLAAFVAVFAFAQTANNATTKTTNENQLIAIAKQALKSSCNDTGGKLQASVNVISACFAGGFITEVTFYRKPNCPPNQVCIQVIETVGTVQLGCDNQVIGVSCGSAVLQ